jgi:hypothetical protein
MKLRSLALAALACAVPFAASPLGASSDSTCYPEWKLRHTDMDGCSSTALLSPGNDTRVNLLMLLFDRHGSVGVSHVLNYDSWYDGQRRGQAQPFGWAYFAGTLGSSPKIEAAGEGGDEGPSGTRCMSNEAGARAFITAVGAAKGLSGEERATLTSARSALRPQCTSEETSRATVEAAVQGVASRAGKAFASYLIGAAAFYDGDFAGAQGAFALAAKAKDKWLAGAATYMLARSALNRATQSAFDDYGSLSKAGGNRSALAEAEAGLQGYLKAEPSGSYAASARGLLRRVYWLGQDRHKLTNSYVAAFAEKNPATRNISLVDLVQEMDIKLLAELKPADVTDPELLTVILLRDMRYFDDGPDNSARSKPISKAEIESYRSRFAGREDLYSYVLAAHAYYVTDSPAEVLQLIPEDPAATGYLAFSRQLLRAAALDASGQPGARAALIATLNAARHPFQRGSAELALAMHFERSKALDLVFADGSPIQDAEIRERLLRYSAGPNQLRARATDAKAAKMERDVALYALLYKQLLRGDYSGFVRDSALVPANAKRIGADDYQTPRYTDLALFNWAGQRDFACPSLRSVATSLSANPSDARSLICLGEFVRTNGLDPDYYGVTMHLDQSPAKDELGGAPSLFPGKRFSRLQAYKAIIANPAAGEENHAYALHRAVRCYAPAGYNGCDDSEQPLSVRKAWFQQLKREFPNSPWSKKLAVYW